MEAALLNIVQKINGYLSDYILIILLVGAGLYFSIRTRSVLLPERFGGKTALHLRHSTQ